MKEIWGEFQTDSPLGLGDVLFELEINYLILAVCPRSYFKSDLSPEPPILSWGNSWLCRIQLCHSQLHLALKPQGVLNICFEAPSRLAGCN